MDIVSAATSALASHPDPEIARREFVVDLRDGKLRLGGVVSSYYHSQLAQEAIRPLINGTRLVNSIKVL
jgi:hypothetical protein